MKNFLFPFALLFAAGIIFTACNGNGPDEPPVVEVTGISLDRNALTLLVGEIGTIIATVTPEDADDKTVTWSSSHPNIASVDENGVVTAVAVGTAVITAQAGNQTANVAVRVLNYGVRIGEAIWATRNVDAPGTFAQNPRSPGMFYQWNRRVGWFSEDPMENSDGGTVWDNSVPEGTTWERVNDPCPQGWRVPTREELQSLADAPSTWSWGNQMINSLAGRYFGTVPNQIFLPVAGYRQGANGVSFHAGGLGFYWSSEQDYDIVAWSLWLGSGQGFVGNGRRTYGYSVRCVAE